MKELEEKHENFETKGCRPLEREVNSQFVVVLTGPNGSGKGTIVNELLSNEKLNLIRIKRFTTKDHIGSNQNDEYIFINNNEFEDLIRKDYFIESVDYGVVKPMYYGTPKEELKKTLASGNNVILDMQIEEALLLRLALEQEHITCIDIFISPVDSIDAISDPNKAIDVVKKRMLLRSRENLDEIGRRLVNVRRIINQLPYFTYFVGNADGKLSTSLDDVLNIIVSHRELVNLVQYLESNTE